MPSEPRWLTTEHAIEFNRLAVAHTNEPFQVRDAGLLESALDSPKNHWQYGEHRIPVLAGHLLLAIARNHPFAQGNKRVALLVADAFLVLNSHRLTVPDESLADLILAALMHEKTDDEFRSDFAAGVALIRRNSRHYPVRTGHRIKGTVLPKPKA